MADKRTFIPGVAVGIVAIAGIAVGAGLLALGQYQGWIPPSGELIRKGAELAGLQAPAPNAATPATPETPATPAATAGRREVGSLVLENVPDTPQDVQDTLLQYQNTRFATLQDWTPDGALIVRTRFGETAQLHRVAMPMGDRKQLTFFDEPVQGGLYPRAADAAGFVFLKDQGGDENYQLFLRKADGSDLRISVEGTRNTDPAWSRDGKFIAWSEQSQESDVYKVYVADIADPGSRRVIYEKEGAWAAADWSPDNSKILLFHYVSATEAHLFVYDIATQAVAEINPSETKIAYEAAMFAPDGNAIYATSNEGREFLTLMRYELTGGGTAVSGDIAWDVEEFDISPDGAKLAFVTNEAGLSRMHVLSLPDHTELAAPDLPPGIVANVRFSPDSKLIGFTFTNAQSSGDVWTYAIGPNMLTRWTESEIGGLDASRFVMPELVEFQTFDQTPDGQPRKIPAFVYKPATGSGPFPVIVYIHGGPEAQERPDFAAVFQYWINELGAAIVAPNVRGSSGYGTTYLGLDDGYKREDSVKDIGALLDWIATQPDLDAKRVVLYGGSYGGYMVNACLTHYSDRLAGGVSIVGVANFVTFLENTSGYRRDLRRVEYGDERDPKMREFLEQIAPVNNAGKIRVPIFLVTGANDPRVPAHETELMIDAVRKNGIEAWYMLAKDEGHGYQKKSNRDAMNAAVVMFFRKFLLGQTAGQ